jgi:hypothetical protein
MSATSAAAEHKTTPPTITSPAQSDAIARIQAMAPFMV